VEIGKDAKSEYLRGGGREDRSEYLRGGRREGRLK